MKNKNYIIELLEDSAEPHLADALDFLPEEIINAIDTMVTQLRKDNKQRALIKYYLVQDVAAGLSGKHHAQLHAFKFLKSEIIGTL